MRVTQLVKDRVVFNLKQSFTESPGGFIHTPFLATYGNFAFIFSSVLTLLLPVPGFLALISLDTFLKL